MNDIDVTRVDRLSQASYGAAGNGNCLSLSFSNRWPMVC